MGRGSVSAERLVIAPAERLARLESLLPFVTETTDFVEETAHERYCFIADTGACSCFHRSLAIELLATLKMSLPGPKDLAALESLATIAGRFQETLARLSHTDACRRERGSSTATLEVCYCAAGRAGAAFRPVASALLVERR